MSDDYYDFEPDIPDDHVLCPRCMGHQEVPCHCGGDLCVCENYGDMPCPLCGGEYGGEGYVPKETADKYLARQAEFAEAFRTSHRATRENEMNDQPTGHITVDGEPMAYWLPEDIRPGDIGIKHTDDREGG